MNCVPFLEIVAETTVLARPNKLKLWFPHTTEDCRILDYFNMDCEVSTSPSLQTRIDERK